MKHHFSIFFFLLLIMFIVWKYSSFCCKRVTLVPEPLIALQSHSAIKQFTRDCLQNNTSYKECVHAVQKKFPFLKHIRWSVHPFNSILEVELYKPLAIINSQSIFTENNNIFDISLFTEQYREHIPEVSVEPGLFSTLLPIISKVVYILPPEYSDLFRIDVVNKHTITLRDIHDEHYALVCLPEQKISESVIYTYNSIKNNLAQTMVGNKKISYVVDIRFAHYIIAYKA